MTIKRLIVDDIRDLPLDPSVTVRTAAEAIAAVQHQDWDEIWLDFDLGGKPYETDDELTIMPFVKFLAERNWHSDECIGAFYRDGGQTGCICGGDDRYPIIYIHTMNPVGRQRIVAALQDDYEIRHVALGFERRYNVEPE